MQLASTEQVSQPSQPSSSNSAEQRVRIARLAIRAFPQLLIFNGAISLSVALLLGILDYVSRLLLSSMGTALTTANAAQVLLSWQGALLAIVTTLIVAGYVAIDVFAHVYFCESILAGEEGGLIKRALRSMRRALKSLLRFRTPSGVLIFIFIVLLSPLAGVGFSTGLTRDLYVPHFIMSVIQSAPLYLVAYVLFVLALAVVGVLHVFSIHDVLLEGASPRHALKRSRQLVRMHLKDLIKAVLKLGIAIGLVVSLGFIAQVAVDVILEMLGQNYTPGEEGALMYLLSDLEPPEEALAVSMYRSLCFFASLIALGVVTIGGLLIGSGTMLYVTHVYHWVSGSQREEPRYLLPPRRTHWWANALRLIIVLAVVAVVSLVAGFAVEIVMHRETPVEVVAHRLGGDGAPENSIEGLKFAIGEGCYGAETDIQRTKDGHYVINHDNDFSRLCGVKAKPQELTLEEVERLRIRDPLHPGTEVEVPTFEELLDAAKGRIKLFVEFKGDTADCKMVDDAVRIAREHGAEDDVVFISLNYDCIEYGKKTYPEFDYGLLIFAGFGDLKLLECDIVLAEEEMSNDDFIDKVHEAGKKMGVWTANTEDDLRKVLHSDADYVITDKVVFARDVQEGLDQRSDSEFIQDLVWR